MAGFASKAEALELTRAQDTGTIIEGLLLTDALLEALDGISHTSAVAQRLAIYETRGWMITILDERGELDRVLDGLDG